MLADALVIIIYVALIIFIITLTILCIKLIGTLNKVDYLVDNVTRKAESLDGVFNLIDVTTSKFGAIGETIFAYISNAVSKVFGSRKNNKRKREENLDE